jgi:hypothetical protein
VREPLQSTTQGAEPGPSNDLLPLLLAPAAAGASEVRRIVGEVRRLAKRSVFDDDVTLLVVTFL